MRPLRQRALRALLPLLLVGCADSTGPDGSLDASFSASYSGAGVSGTLSAERAPERTSSGEIRKQSYAVAVMDAHRASHEAPDSSLLVLGVDVSEDAYMDAMMLMVEDYTRQSYTFGEDCVDATTGDSSRCAFGLLVVDMHVDAATEVHDKVFVIAEGTLTLTSVSTQRVRGTVSGTAYPIDLMTGEIDYSSAVSVTNGSFDAPVWDDSEWESAGTTSSRSPAPDPSLLRATR